MTSVVPETTHKVRQVVGTCDWCGHEVCANVDVRTTVEVSSVNLDSNDVQVITNARIVHVEISHTCWSAKDSQEAKVAAALMSALVGGPDGSPENHDHVAVVPDLPAETPTWATQHEQESN